MGNTQQPAGDIDGVIRRLDEVVEQSLREGSRLALFACLYGAVTQRVKEGILAGRFDQQFRETFGKIGSTRDDAGNRTAAAFEMVDPLFGRLGGDEFGGGLACIRVSTQQSGAGEQADRNRG